jgi:hypothetical protein
MASMFSNSISFSVMATENWFNSVAILKRDDHCHRWLEAAKLSCMHGNEIG